MLNDLERTKSLFISLIDQEVYSYLETTNQTLVMLPVIGATAGGFMQNYSIVGFILPKVDVDQLNREGRVSE